MSKLLDILQGRDREKEEKIKREAEAATKDYERRTGATVPEEKGIIEGDVDMLVPSREYELAERGYQFGAGPSKKKPGVGAVQKLLDAGVPEPQIKEIAQELRMGRPYTFKNADGTPGGTIGGTNTGNSFIDELKAYGRKVTDDELIAKEAARAAAGPATKAAKPPRISGEAKEYYERTGVDPTRKSAVDAMKELRNKGR